MDKVGDILHTAPHQPGVYLMKDARGTIFYVGKAKDLHQRMHQYIHPVSDTRAFVRTLDRQLESVEFILTSSETEALLLEQTLIKKHRPRCNIRIKDDSAYASLRLDLAHPYPRLDLVRRRGRERAQTLHFGPYPSAAAARRVMTLVNRHFRLRDCHDDVFARSKRPCLRYQMGRCLAPCSLPVERDAYLAEIAKVRLFLEGRTQTLSAEIKEQMSAASEALEFERAAALRDLLAAIDATIEKQAVDLPRDIDWDVLGFYREGEEAALAVLKVREGRLVGRDTRLVNGRAEPDAAIVGAFIAGTYGGVWPLPATLLVPHPPTDAEALAAWLGERRGAQVALRTPERGDGVRLLGIANANAHAAFEQHASRQAQRLQSLQRLAAVLDLPAPPARIECFDISNISGQLAVGSMVCMIDGGLAKAAYRRFRIKLSDSPDDFTMMREVLMRRLTRGLKEGDLPDLLVVDGGLGQLAVAETCLREAGVSGVQLAGLAKSRLKDEVGPGQISETFEGKQRTPERVFRPHQKNPVVLKPGTAELSLLVTLRDEAHRFAITYHRLLRSRRALHSGLQDIPGVGARRAKALLKHFGSLKRLRDAAPEAIAAVPGCNAALADAVWRHLHEPDPAE